MSSRRFAQGFAVVLAIAALAAAASAYAAKPSSYSPTLGVSWPALGTTATTSGSSTSFVVSGCGYDSSLGGVTIVVSSPYATAFAGQMPDSNGCISLSNFATQGPGTYSIQAWQHVRNKDTVVASTSFTQ